MATFDGDALLITLNATGGVGVVDALEDLYEQWKAWQLESGAGGSSNRRYPQAFRPDGGNPLTPGITQGSYTFIRNDLGWRIKPAEEDATILFTGNLAPSDSALPILVPTLGGYTVGVFGLQPITQSVESLITQQAASTVRLQHLIAGQDDTHSPFGNVFYVDSVNGDDSNDGLLPTTAREHVQSVHDALCTGYTRDTIIVLGRDPANATTVISEKITITKNHVMLSGPGRGVCFITADDSEDTITIDGAFGVEIDSLRINTGPGPTPRHAIRVINNACHAKLSNLYIDVEGVGNNVTGNGIHIEDGNHHVIDNCYLKAVGGDAVCLDNAPSSTVTGCKIYVSGGDGIRLRSTAGAGIANHITLNDNVIQHSVGDDISIDADVDFTSIRFLNDISGTQRINDNSLSTEYERRNFIGFIAAAVHDARAYRKRDNITYDANGFPVSGRERWFPDEATANAATYGGVGEGETRTRNITATPDGTFPSSPRTFDEIEVD